MWGIEKGFVFVLEHPGSLGETTVFETLTQWAWSSLGNAISLKLKGSFALIL